MMQIFDKQLELVTNGTEFTATGESTAITVDGLHEGYNDFTANLNISAVGGTHDASNYFTIQLLASADNSNFFKIGEAITETATGKRTIKLNSEQVAQSAGTGAKYFKVSVTKTGTTATGITFGAYLTK